jgi:hypothetical protein
VPPKIQLFLWLVSHNRLATVDNLNKRGLQKTDQCQFCNETESNVHLFFFFWKGFGIIDLRRV